MRGARNGPGGPGDYGGRGRRTRRSGAALIALAVMALLSSAPARAFDEASVQAALFQRARAESLGVPLVLLSHETHCDMQGNGRREIEEDWIWYVGDPDSPRCDQVRHPRVLLEAGLELFGLEQCRVFRDRDTLHAQQGVWKLGVPAGWPCATATSWSEASAELPKLHHGDVVQIAYAVRNRWAPDRIPSDWQVLPVRHPGVPTLARSITLTYTSLIDGQVKLIGDPARLIRHWGEINPEIELQTGDLPPGPEDPTAPGSARLLFTTSPDWESLRHILVQVYAPHIRTGEEAYAALGDSLSRQQAATRPRLAAVLQQIEKDWARIPRSLTASLYYPQSPRALGRTGCADRLDRALLFVGLAGASRLQAEVFLARSGAEPLLSDLATPMQFDRILVRVLLADEDRHLLLDPWEPTLDAATAAVPRDVLLFGIPDTRSGFYEVTDDGALQPRTFPARQPTR